MENMKKKRKGRLTTLMSRTENPTKSKSHFRGKPNLRITENRMFTDTDFDGIFKKILRILRERWKIFPRRYISNWYRFDLHTSICTVMSFYLARETSTPREVQGKVKIL